LRQPENPEFVLLLAIFAVRKAATSKKNPQQIKFAADGFFSDSFG
jgi:hypothetical protein